MNKLIREPLLHFLLLGPLLFGVYGVLHRNAAQAPDKVVVDQARVDALASQFQQVWQRAPTAVELQGLIETWARDEILYREGVASGVDKDDPVIRRRVAQKMAFLSEGMIADLPSEADLQGWLDAHAGDYRIESTYSLRQVYVDPQRHVAKLRETIERTLAALRQGRASGVGDPTLVPATLEAAPAREVARTFGEAFVDALRELPEHEWQGSVRSAYGLHLVRVDARVPARAATLADVRQAVERDFMKSRTDAIAKSFYDAMRARYTVVMEAKLPSTALVQRSSPVDAHSVTR